MVSRPGSVCDRMLRSPSSSPPGVAARRRIPEGVEHTRVAARRALVVERAREVVAELERAEQPDAERGASRRTHRSHARRAATASRGPRHQRQSPAAVGGGRCNCSRFRRPCSRTALKPTPVSGRRRACRRVDARRYCATRTRCFAVVFRKNARADGRAARESSASGSELCRNSDGVAVVAERAVELAEVVEVDARQAAHGARRDRVRADRGAKAQRASAPLGSRRSAENLQPRCGDDVRCGRRAAGRFPRARDVTSRRAPLRSAHYRLPTLLHRDRRVFGVEVPVDLDDKHTSLDVSERLRHALAERLGLGAPPPLDDIQLVRKSLDARPRRAGGRRGKLIGGHEVAGRPSST